MHEIKFFDVTGKLMIDDLGFTLTDFPSNNTVYETWSSYGAGAGRTEPIVLGTSPHTATFDGGSILVEYSDGGNYTRTSPNTYGVFNGEEATITFETPAYKIDMFAAQSTPPKEGINPDGFIDGYDTQGNLVLTVDNLEGDVLHTLPNLGKANHLHLLKVLDYF